MNCNEAKKLMTLYIDNMLEPDQMNAIAEHLTTCDACNQEYQEITQILSLLANIEDVPLPEAFDMKLRSQLEKEAVALKKGQVTPLVKNKWRGWRRLTSIAAVFVVGLFSVLLYNNLNEFNPNNLGDTYKVATISEDAPKETAKDSKVLQEEQNPEMVNEDADAEIEYGLEAPLKNSMVEASPNTESEVTDSDKSAAGVPKMTMDAASLSEEATTKSTETATESLVDDSKVKRSCSYLGNKFNPSRFLQALSEEDAQIYTELINVHTLLSSGRDSIAAIYYVKQLKELLGDCEYELISCFQEPEGQWNINISITSIDENGNEIKEDATYCGQGGKLWKKELSLSTETV